jgi:hypothetical protein
MERESMTDCKKGKCEYEPTLDRKLVIERTPEEIEYGRLWAETELPKLLRGENPQ